MSPSPSWWRCRTPRPDAPWRLLCFPHAGGAASFFAAWAAELGDGVEVVVAQYPGREDRIAEPSIGRIAPLVDALAQDVPLDRPTVFLGHSMGALVAYELARTVAPGGPRHLVVSGAAAPDIPRSTGIAGQDDDGVLAEIDRLGGSTEALRASPELRTLLMPGIRGDFGLVDAYRHRPGPRLGCPVTSLVGDTDPRVTVEQAAGWARFTDGPFTAHVLPGGHFAIADPARRRTAVGVLHDLMTGR